MRSFFARLDEKHKLLGNFEKILRKFVTKNRAFGNNTIFLQQFFRFRGGGLPPLPPWLRPCLWGSFLGCHGSPTRMEAPPSMNYDSPRKGVLPRTAVNEQQQACEILKIWYVECMYKISETVNETVNPFLRSYFFIRQSEWIHNH